MFLLAVGVLNPLNQMTRITIARYESAMLRAFLLALLLAVANYLPLQAQPSTYSVANAHAHNDYEHSRPFYDAYELGFGSIEADVYLRNGELYVAHNAKDIQSDRTLRKLYLAPMLEKIAQNKGWPYPDRKELQFLVDIKDNGAATLAALQKLLTPHRRALRHVRIVVSGDMPVPGSLATQDKIFTFDGRKDLLYPEAASPRVKLVSASMLSFGKYWDGRAPLDEAIRERLVTFIALQHAQKKLVRLWATSNNATGYQTLKDLGVDYIGSDDLTGLAAFLSGSK